MKEFLPFALVAGFLVAADTPRTVSDELQGRWPAGVTTNHGGLEFVVVNAKGPVGVLDVTNDLVTLKCDRHEGRRWSYALGRDQVSPHAIDLTMLDGPDQGKMQKGIYTIKLNSGNGYDLRIGMARAGQDRPKTFAHKPEEGLETHSFARYPTPRRSR